MIIKERIDLFEPEIKKAVDQLFIQAKYKQKVPGDYIAFLANGFYDADWVDTIQCKRGVSPYMINSKRESWYKDADRVEYYVTYINSNPALLLENIPEADKDAFIKFCTTTEMLIYSHIWESTRLLKILTHLANLVKGERYDWKLTIPKFTRHTHIRKNIRDVLKKHKLVVADLMSRSYHSQIRNAFAHSDYSFGNGLFNDDILLWNYEKQHDSWQKSGIKFDEWNERFTISILLADYIIEKFQMERKNLGDNIFKIYTPDFPQEEILRSIVVMYKPDYDDFTFIHESSGKYSDNIIFPAMLPAT